MHVYERHLCSACGEAQGLLTSAASAALAGFHLLSLCLHCSGWRRRGLTVATPPANAGWMLLEPLAHQQRSR
jgi:hypothetical protein